MSGQDFLYLPPIQKMQQIYESEHLRLPLTLQREFINIPSIWEEPQNNNLPLKPKTLSLCYSLPSNLPPHPAPRLTNLAQKTSSVCAWRLHCSFGGFQRARRVNIMALGCVQNLGPEYVFKLRSPRGQTVNVFCLILLPPPFAGLNPRFRLGDGPLGPTSPGSVLCSPAAGGIRGGAGRLRAVQGRGWLQWGWEGPPRSRAGTDALQRDPKEQTRPSDLASIFALKYMLLK